MKAELKVKKNESLQDWIGRLAKYWNFGDELEEMINEISKESYIRGNEEAMANMDAN